MADTQTAIIWSNSPMAAAQLGLYIIQAVTSATTRKHVLPALPCTLSAITQLSALQ